MNALLEKLNADLFKRSEVEGVDPLVISNVLLPNEGIQKRTASITKFFDESDGGFTYQKFKSILSPSIAGVFKTLAEPKKKIQSFAKSVKVDVKGSTKIEYDEYPETFFMYLYYQLFVKLLSNPEVILSKNKESIENTKSIISSIPEPLRPDVDENLVKLYRSFYTSFGSSIADPSRLKTDKGEQETYFENFANQNVQLFVSYPISDFMEELPSMDVRDFIDSMFDAVKEIPSRNTNNRQILTIRVLSEFVSGSDVDFDIVKFQGLAKEYPFLSEQGPIRFPSKTEASISDAVTELSSIDIGSIGMDWAEGTKWEPYIKLICAIVSLEEISGKVKSIAKTIRKQKSIYQAVLDKAEPDGGVYFINNQAFVEASERVEKYKTVIDDLDAVTKTVETKMRYFQEIDGKKLLDSMFVKYDKNMAASDINTIGKEKGSLENIMKLTGLIDQFGSNFIDASSEINFIFLSQGNEIRGKPNQRNEDAIEYAKLNLGDLILNDITESEMSAFYPSRVGAAVVEITGTAKDALSKILTGPMTIQSVIDSFNETFSREFDFARMEKSGDNYVIKMGTNDRTIYEFDSIEKMKDYIIAMSVSMGSMGYHSKVAFGGNPQGRDERYKRYFNVLSWFVKALDEFGKTRSLGTPQYPFVYLLTPFLLNVIKYSFRAFVNEIEDVLFENDLISKELRDSVKKSHKKESMEDEEWKPIVEELSVAIEQYLKNR